MEETSPKMEEWKPHEPKPVVHREKVKLTRAQIFRLLREEDLSQDEVGQTPVFTHYINPNLP